MRWDMGLNQKRIAWFNLPKLESGEVRLAVGDELRLRYNGELHKAWEGLGHVIKIPNSTHYYLREVARSLTRLCRRLGRDRSRTSQERRRPLRLHSQLLCRLCLEVDLVRPHAARDEDLRRRRAECQRLHLPQAHGSRRGAAASPSCADAQEVRFSRRQGSELS